MAGTNWSGSHDKRQCVGGLDKDSIDNIIQKIRNPCDFNVIRLTFSIQMVYENPIIDKKLTSANP